MTLQLLGAGFPRTGSTSLKLAVERLLGGRCYYMGDVFERLEHVPVWRGALRGELPDWQSLFAGYVAAVDWPASAVWRELVAEYPHAVVVLSTRRDPATWWQSADRTILELARRTEQPTEYGDWPLLFRDLLGAEIGAWKDALTAIAAYEQHNAEVRGAVPSDRLVDWTPEDGWPPLCAALDVQVPDEPFPHVNTTAEWLAGATR